MPEKSQYLKGQLLLDGGELHGSFFQRTVLLICQHDAEGAFGLILNRESGSKAGEMIVADLPAGERPELRRIQLVAPTSTDERLRLAGEQTDGWLYLVTVTGTTGARSGLSGALAGLAERARAAAPDVPLYAGFGISSPDDARAAADLTDGVVVGSRALEEADNGPAALRAFVRSLRDGLDRG